MSQRRVWRVGSSGTTAPTSRISRADGQHVNSRGASIDASAYHSQPSSDLAPASGRPPPYYYWDGKRWAYTGGQFGDGRERRASEFARHHAQRGDPQAFIEAVDEYHASRGKKSSLIHVGHLKGKRLDEAVRAREPVTVVEFGTHIGYSAIRIARLLARGAHLWTIEPNPENAELASENLDHVGLSDMVTVCRGTFEDVWWDLPQPMDFLFLDHQKSKYLREIKNLERWGYIARGTVVAADNIGGVGHGPGRAFGRRHSNWKADEYANYVRNGGGYTSTFYWGDDDGIEVSEAVGPDKTVQDVDSRQLHKIVPRTTTTTSVAGSAHGARRCWRPTLRHRDSGAEANTNLEFTHPL